VTPALAGGTALTSLIGFIAVYAVVFTAGIYYIARVVQAGMEHFDVAGAEEPEHAKRPMSAVHTPLDRDAEVPSAADASGDDDASTPRAKPPWL
jgi:cytochrome d ubiquinol oxidase subunit I